ncbi:MAG: MltA domain-containing protein [Nitrospirota bacterium]|nr:MltA domain-containing protein [Nitrospirota bacterium]
MFLLTSCAKPPVTKPEFALEQVSWWRAGLKADDLEFQGLAEAARQSMEYYKRLPADSSFVFGPIRVTAGDMVVTLQNLLLIVENTSLTPELKVEQIKNGFDIYRSVGSNGRGKVLFTGYYEPVLSCRRTADDTYKFPLYKRPDDILEIDLSQFGENFGKDRIFGRLNGKKVIPYFSRQEIDQQKQLAGKGLEVLWCADLVDIYTVQVQGSGKADLGNGEIVGILYDGQNGRPYRGIGRYLIDSGAIPKEKMSMPAIRDYLKANPEKLFDILHQNPSYVFFKVENKLAVGNINVPLTARRSIATDYRLFPKGALALIRTEKPVIAEDGTVKEWNAFTRFVMNQDTGGAIRGAGRVDLFWGQGKEAELSAGYMQQEGKLYFLLRKKEERNDSW